MMQPANTLTWGWFEWVPEIYWHLDILVNSDSFTILLNDIGHYLPVGGHLLSNITLFNASEIVIWNEMTVSRVHWASTVFVLSFRYGCSGGIFLSYLSRIPTPILMGNDTELQTNVKNICGTARRLTETSPPFVHMQNPDSVWWMRIPTKGLDSNREIPLRFFINGYFHDRMRKQFAVWTNRLNHFLQTMTGWCSTCIQFHCKSP